MKVDWTKWSAIAEILSSIAIVVTLVILIVQTTENTRATLAPNRQSVAGRAEELLSRQTDPVVASILVKVNNESPLDEQESIIYFGWLHARLRNAEEAYLQYREGYLSEAYWGTRLAAALAVTSTDFARETFYEAGHVYTQEFREVLTEALGDAYQD